VVLFLLLAFGVSLLWFHLLLVCVCGLVFGLEMLGSGTNLVTTVIGFGMSATFIVFVCTRIICGRLRAGVESRMVYEIESRIDIEQVGSAVPFSSSPFSCFC